MTIAETFTTEVREAEIDARHLGVLSERIEKLNRRCRRLGLEEITFSVLSRGERRTGHRDSIVVPTVTIAICGQTPRLAGWSFVGVVEHLPSGDNLIHGDDPRLEAWRVAASDCGHCNISRHRKKTIIAEHEVEGLKQIGTTCIKDFFGYHSNPETLVGYVSDLRDLSDFDDFGGFSIHGARAWAPEIVVAASIAFSERYGWTPRSAQDGIPTADWVSYYLGDRAPSRVLQREVDSIKITSEHYAKAVEQITWARAIDAATPSNYLQNLRTILSQDLILSKHLGLACSVVIATVNEAERAQQAADREAARAESIAQSEWQGRAGDKITIEGEIIGVREFNGYAYNSPPTHLVTIKDEAGNIFKTFNSGAFGREAEVGEAVRVKATIKKHDLYNDRKETVLTRVRAA